MSSFTLQHTYTHVLTILPILKLSIKSYFALYPYRNAPATVSASINKCDTCYYYSESSIKLESECYKFGKQGPDINGKYFYNVIECRTDENKCGRIGKYYIYKLLK